MASFIPKNPAALLNRADSTLGNVDGVLGRVAGNPPRGQRNPDRVAEEMALLRQVPDIAAQVAEIHQLVSAR